LQVPGSKLLKEDVFGRTERLPDGESGLVRRDAAAARPLLRWLSRRLIAREARALAVLDGVPGIPRLVNVDRDVLVREFIAGKPMQVARPADPAYFRSAARLVRRLHRLGIAHNDLAKEPNFLCDNSGEPAIIDFQLSLWTTRRGTLFRVLAREDIRHLLKHKRTYCPRQLTRRERQILDRPALISRIWMKTAKPLYLFVTRRLLGWQDREGAGDRV